eukprot:SAG31_NODE_1610_length_7751_cov_2.938447_2_plen_82_part_00
MYERSQYVFFKKKYCYPVAAPRRAAGYTAVTASAQKIIQRIFLKNTPALYAVSKLDTKRAAHFASHSSGTPVALIHSCGRG